MNTGIRKRNDFTNSLMEQSLNSVCQIFVMALYLHCYIDIYSDQINKSLPRLSTSTFILIEIFRVSVCFL